MSYSSMLNDYTLEELYETAANYGLIDADLDADSFDSERLVELIREYHEESAAQDHYSSFYSY